MGGIVRKNIKEALYYVRDHPAAPEDMLETPAYELVARALVAAAASTSGARGGMARTTKAQRILFDRTVGTRKPGSQPIARQSSAVEYHDLTKGSISL